MSASAEVMRAARVPVIVFMLSPPRRMGAKSMPLGDPWLFEDFRRGVDLIASSTRQERQLLHARDRNFYTPRPWTSSASTDCRKPPTVVNGPVTDFSPSSCNAYTTIRESRRARSSLPGTHLAARNADRSI